MFEETGVTARLLGVNGHVEVMARDPEGRIERHFVVASFLGAWVAGEGRTSDEARTILWADPAKLQGLPLTPGLQPLLAKAVATLEKLRLDAV